MEADIQASSGSGNPARCRGPSPTGRTDRYTHPGQRPEWRLLRERGVPVSAILSLMRRADTACQPMLIRTAVAAPKRAPIEIHSRTDRNRDARLRRFAQGASVPAVTSLSGSHEGASVLSAAFPHKAADCSVHTAENSPLAYLASMLDVSDVLIVCADVCSAGFQPRRAAVQTPFLVWRSVFEWCSSAVLTAGEPLSVSC